MREGPSGSHHVLARLAKCVISAEDTEEEEEEEECGGGGGGGGVVECFRRWLCMAGSKPLGLVRGGRASDRDMHRRRQLYGLH